MRCPVTTRWKRATTGACRQHPATQVLHRSEVYCLGPRPGSRRLPRGSTTMQLIPRRLTPRHDRPTGPPQRSVPASSGTGAVPGTPRLMAVHSGNAVAWKYTSRRPERTPRQSATAWL